MYLRNPASGRGVLPDVERRLHPVAHHGAVAVVVAHDQRGGRYGERRRPARPARSRRRAGPSRTCRRARSRTPAGRAAPASPGPAAANTAPWTSRDCGCRTPSRMTAASTAVSPRTGSSAVSHARRRRRWDSDVPSRPASRPSSHGSTSSGPSPSTGGSVVSRSFQPKIAWSTSVDSVGPPGRKAVSPTDRRHSGPPSRKNTHGEDQHRRDERPAERPAQVGHGHGDDRPESCRRRGTTSR